MVECFSDDAIGYLGGRLLLFDPEDCPVIIQTLDKRVALPARSPIEVGLIHGANMAFRRELVDAIGYFDEKLGAGTKLRSGEDLGYLARMSAHGFAGAYDPRPTIFHHHRRKLPDQVAGLQRDYDFGRGAFYAKAMVDRRLRPCWVRPIYWNTRNNLLRGNFRIMQREMKGAARYLAGG